ncbi:helix-turn-helix transcriptional regulator [Larkinella bovis]|uniref:Helix-turn-helix transcriptional regulator n=1 Tax=Larkinella bovis TaxID=683041 RepID=A0ABW0IKQ2_9BACT
MATASTQSDWLRPKDVQTLMKIGSTRFWQLVREGAFPVSRPSGKLVYIRRTDVENFFQNGYAKAA